jgi:hypothetical protein
VNTVETVLVILLSVGFVTLLILSVVLLSIMISIMKNVKRISQRAEEASGNVASIVETIGRRVAPIALSGVATAVLRWFRKKKEED